MCFQYTRRGTEPNHEGEMKGNQWEIQGPHSWDVQWINLYQKSLSLPNFSSSLYYDKYTKLIFNSYLLCKIILINQIFAWMQFVITHVSACEWRDHSSCPTLKRNKLVISLKLDVSVMLSTLSCSTMSLSCCWLM